MNRQRLRFVNSWTTVHFIATLVVSVAAFCGAPAPLPVLLLNLPLSLPVWLLVDAPLVSIFPFALAMLPVFVFGVMWLNSRLCALAAWAVWSRANRFGVAAERVWF
ncbi:MAG: hypothetical protein HUU35_09300 [Armatimonadetes bacterium]|nr:hypothetical protein [Armatimonadota bacterium]